MSTNKLALLEADFLYVSEVLGVRAILSPNPLSPAESDEQSDKSPSMGKQAELSIRADVVENSQLLVVGWNTPSQLYSFRHGPRGDLLQKMLLAMQIPQDRVSYIEVEGLVEAYTAHLFDLLQAELLKSGARHVLVFSQAGLKSFYREIQAGGVAERRHRGPANWGQVVGGGPYRWLLTYDPQILLDDPTKKREAWNHLKLLMREIL